jgi:hypothetical protein
MGHLSRTQTLNASYVTVFATDKALLCQKPPKQSDGITLTDLIVAIEQVKVLES